MAIHFDFSPKPLNHEGSIESKYECEHFYENFALIVRHADFILKYRELAELKLQCIGYSFCWYKGARSTQGEFGSIKYNLPYEFPETHVPEAFQSVPWNVFYLVQLLKEKEKSKNN